MEGEQEPIVVVLESRIDLVFHVGGRAVHLIPVVANLHRLAFLIFSFEGNRTGLGLPRPRPRHIHFQGRKIQIERIADRFNLPVRINPIGLGKLFDNGWARLCPGGCSKDQDPESQKKDLRYTARICHGVCSSVN